MSPSNMVNYPKSLTLTDDSNLESALGDIPFSSVGVLGLGTFLFFLSMQRVTKVVAYLHMSMITAFIGGILDIIQIIRRNDNAFHGPSISVAAMMISSQVVFALSTGFRFIFFWAFTGEPPHGESLISPVTDDRRLNFIVLAGDSISSRHSGDWSRWGLSGLLLKWCLLALSCAIAILQGIWRLDNELPRNSTVYVVESTMEIVLSALFILKLLANLWLSPLTPRWKTLRNYSPFLFALLINMGLGVGNILVFQFSESVLGRFLQALILNILSTVVLIFSFYKLSMKSGVFEELMRKNLFDRATFDMPQEKGVEMMEIPGARDSVMSKISTWIGAQEKLEDIEAGERPSSHPWEQSDRAPSPNSKQSPHPSGDLPEKSYDFGNILKQQEQLERSLAELQQFGPKKMTQSRASPVQSIGASFRSLISLSNFPNPPHLQSKNLGRATMATSRSVFMDNTEFQMVSHYPDVGPTKQPRKSSIPFTDDQSYVGEQISRLGSSITRYDVTSFIGDLSEPAAEVSTSSTNNAISTLHDSNGGIHEEHTISPSPSLEILNVYDWQPVASDKDGGDATPENTRRNGVEPLLVQRKGRIGLPQRPLMRPEKQKLELDRAKDPGFF